MAIEINSDDHAELEQELEDTKKASKALKSLKKRPEELVSFCFRFRFRFCFDWKYALPPALLYTYTNLWFLG